MSDGRERQLSDEDGRTATPAWLWWLGFLLGVAVFVGALTLPLPRGLERITALKVQQRLPAALAARLAPLTAKPRDGAEPVADAKLLAAARAIRVRVNKRDGRIIAADDLARVRPAERRRYGKVSTVAQLIAGMRRAARGALACGLLMVVFWIFSVLPTAITALLPLVLFPVLGVASLVSPKFPGYFVVSAQYGHQLIFLFMGTFVLSQAMTRWKLDERMAFHILGVFGTRPAVLMLGFVTASGFLSMWITNTATTATLTPTALAVLASVKHPDVGRYRTGLLLAVAYASTVGGMATLVGTAPNAIYAAFASSLANHQVSFTEWLAFGLPFVLVFLPMLWLVQAWRFIPRGLELPGRKGLETPGRMTRGEKQVAAVFLMMVLLWVTRRELSVIGWPGWSSFSLGAMSFSWANDSSVAMFGALLLFLWPVSLRERVFTLDLKTGLDISWDTLLLFGGGLALGSAISATGLASWIAEGLHVVAGAGQHLLILAVTLLTSMLTEVASNTATATMLMPVMFALGRSLGGGELRFMATAAVATSMAFMSPIGTPPNAIVYGTGQVSMGQMFRAGAILNLLAALVWWIVAVVLVPG
ncbi:MAG: DASS family sodium-coupled anion symporter [Myxococcales bacterium]|nr:DASS family sodium-coupled anion symporter [Myxococcales bacterium]